MHSQLEVSRQREREREKPTCPQIGNGFNEATRPAVKRSAWQCRSRLNIVCVVVYRSNKRREKSDDRIKKQGQTHHRGEERNMNENLPSVTTGKRSLNPGGRTHLAGRISRMKNKSARRVNTFCFTELPKNK